MDSNGRICSVLSAWFVFTSGHTVWKSPLEKSIRNKSEIDLPLRWQLQLWTYAFRHVLVAALVYIGKKHFFRLILVYYYSLGFIFKRYFYRTVCFQKCLSKGFPLVILHKLASLLTTRTVFNDITVLNLRNY